MKSTVPLLTFLLAVVVAYRLRPRPARPGTEAADRRHRIRIGRTFDHLRSRSATRSTPTPRAVAEWCDHLARRLRSGTTLRDALLTTLPDDETTRRHTEAMRRRLDRGSPIPAAVGAVEAPGSHLHLALTIIGTSARVGGASAPAIDRTAASLRSRAADHDERRAQAAQARMSAHVLTAVPLLMLTVLVVTDSDTRNAVTAPAGMICLGVGLSLNLLGSTWMHRMIRAR